MHSTIAALSSFVPTAILAYSDKAAGVFDECDEGESVVDLRTMDAESVVNTLIDSWQARETTRRRLRATIPRVLEKANAQMDEIAAFCLKSDSLRNKE